jgi:hypothetical protein
MWQTALIAFCKNLPWFADNCFFCDRIAKRGIGMQAAGPWARSAGAYFMSIELFYSIKQKCLPVSDN